MFLASLPRRGLLLLNLTEIKQCKIKQITSNNAYINMWIKKRTTACLPQTPLYATSMVRAVYLANRVN